MGSASEDVVEPSWL